MTESLLLGLAGGGAGLLVANAALEGAAQFAIPGHELLALAKIDNRLLLYGLALAFVSSLIFGIVPALQLLRTNQTAGMVRSRRRWFQSIFIGVEVAGAALRASRIDPQEALRRD